MQPFIIRCVTALTLLTASLVAQEFRASIAGEVTDPAGAAVPNAKVVVTSVERGTPAEAVTNTAGRYLVQFLLPGSYTMTIEAAGFKKFVRENIKLASSDRLGIDVKLELGGLAESVTVNAEVPLLQTESASRTATIENRAIESIPTNGRNLYQLQYTLPGVVKASTYWGSMELYAFGNVNGVIIGGGRQGENETLLDGVSNTRGDRGVAFVPSLNATQEFTIQTNSYDAQFGRVGGGVTTITVKSGTNSLHGQLFEFMKNDKLDANGWESNTFGDERTPFKQHTFGFEVDGPVWIPKVFNGRNRLFYMMSLEGLRESNPGGQVRTLPTAPMLQGDFSGLRNNQGRPVLIYDPTTTALQPGGAYTRTPFAGNRIPQSRINGVAGKVAAFYPQPNRVSESLDNANNYAKITASKNSYDSWLGKMDYRFSQKHNVSWRYGQTPWSNFSRIVWGTNAAEPSGEAPSTRVSRNWGADWTYSINSRMVFNLRGGLARYEGFGGNVYGPGFDPRQLGLPSSLVGQFVALQFPRFNLGTYSELGASSVTSYETHDTWSLQPNLSWIRGRHSMKYGAEFRLYNRNQLQPGSASGNFSFGKNWTQADPLRGDALSGNEFATFLLGYPSGGSVDRNIDPAYQNKYYALFFQDDWKITSKLTVNVGLRWDYETPRVERFNRMIRGFAFDQTSPLASRVQGLNLKGGLLFAGSSGEDRLAFRPDKNNFQPRVGIAWHFQPKWIVRGGYGLTFLGQADNGAATGFSQTTGLISSTDGGLTPAVDLNDPFPSRLFQNGLLKPIGSSLGLATNLGQGVGAQYLDRVLPYSHQYSLGFQHEAPWGFLLDLSYVGNQTRKLPVGVGLNFVPLAELTRLPVSDRPAYFNAQVTNPMAGLLPGSPFNGNTVVRSQLLVAYPQFNGVGISSLPIGGQRYDGLQFKATRRFGQGIGVQAAYTFSKTFEEINLLNAQNTDLANLLNTRKERRLIEFDTPHKISVVVNYELPFGKGKRFGGGMHPVFNSIAGGWNINTQWMNQKGFPFLFPNAAPIANRSPKLSDAQRDELARKQGRPQFDPLFDKYFDVTVFPTRTPAPFTLRDFPTRFGDVRSKPMDEWEISIYKEFAFGRGDHPIRWQVRADMQNALNHPFFNEMRGSPELDVTNSRFGQLRPRDRNEARKIIAVMKIIW